MQRGGGLQGVGSAKVVLARELWRQYRLVQELSMTSEGLGRWRVVRRTCPTVHRHCYGTGDEDFGHGNRGGYGWRRRLRHPGENNVGQGHVLGIFFELINEDAAVQRNAVVTLEGGAEAV